MTTRNEKGADDVDCALYRLISKAEHIAEQDPRHKKAWDRIARELSAVRPSVRVMMKSSRRVETVGE